MKELLIKVVLTIVLGSTYVVGGSYLMARVLGIQHPFATPIVEQLPFHEM